MTQLWAASILIITPSPPRVGSQHHQAWPGPGAGVMVTCSSHGPVTLADGTGSGVAIRHRAIGKGYGVCTGQMSVCSLLCRVVNMTVKI